MRGGARPNCGVKKGHTYKQRIETYFSAGEIEEMVKFAKKEAKKNPMILKMLFEQIFGKPKQNIEMEGGMKLTLNYDGTFNLASKTEGSSTEFKEV